MKFYLNGSWEQRDEQFEVLNPFDGQVIDTVPKATEQDVEVALASAVKGAEAMKAREGIPAERAGN